MKRKFVAKQGFLIMFLYAESTSLVAQSVTLSAISVSANVDFVSRYSLQE